MRNSPRLMRIVSENNTYEDRYLIAVFGNAPLYARYVYWMLDAIMDDGILNMSALRPLAPIPAWYLLLRSFNKDYKTDKVVREASRTFAIELLEESYLQVDGEVYKYQAGEKVNLSVERKPFPSGPKCESRDRSPGSSRYPTCVDLLLPALYDHPLRKRRVC